MKTPILKFVFICLFACIFFIKDISAQSHNTVVSKSVTTSAKFRGKTPPLKNIQLSKSNDLAFRASLDKAKKGKKMPNFPVSKAIQHPRLAEALPKNGDPVRQMNYNHSPEEIVEPEFILEGPNSILSGAFPPDVNGDLSPEHYIHTVNGGGGTLISIYDLEGNLLFGPESMNYLWTELGQTGLGDPIVLWDQDAERWVMTELSLDFSNMLVAVSVTSDPLGEWYIYEFQGFELPDYPKWAVYPQAYIVTTNEGGQTDIPVYVVDKAAMLNGETDVEVQIFGVQRYGLSGFEFANPADWNGNTPPPAGGPMYVLRMFDDSWGVGQDRIDLYEVFVDWNDPNESYINGPIEIPTAPFESQVCEFDAFSCFLQPDGTYMEGIEGVIMHRSNYRNFGSYEAIVLNFLVDASSDDTDRSGIRWVELRKPTGGEWSVYQEGTFAPDLDLHRWMPSINMDGSGSMCMVYAVMGEDKFPSVRFTGRRSSDPLGEMTLEEYEIGTGSAWNFANRWGDYFAVSVDPFDDRTFWITGEYQYEENWGTKIAKLMIRRDTNDIGPLNLVTPVNSGYLTNAETVTATYKNYGYATQSNFDVGVIFENDPAQVVTITNELMPDSTIEVVFPLPVNMEVIGSYNFKIFTSLTGDENPNNDTIEVIVRKLPRFDAAIESIEGLSDAVCNEEVTIGLELKNYGVENLTSADISWQLNGNAANVINWTGNLPYLSSEIINVTLNTSNGLIDGDNELITTSSNPNLMVDEVPSNDQFTRNFVVVIDGGALSLQVLTDDFPTETSWDVEDMDGNVIYESDPYNQGQTLYLFEMCLDPDQCYTLNLYDSFGDGIQYGGIEGDVQIVDEEGQVVFDLAEPNYGGFASFPFCATFQCILSLTGTTSKATNATTADGIIMLSASNGFGPYQYSINNGASYQSNAVFTGLLPGIYQCMVIDFNNCVSSMTLEVLACAVQNTYTVISPDAGQANGSVTINASGGIVPYKFSKNGGISYSSNNTFANLAEGVYIFCAKDFENCKKCDTLELASLVGTYNLNAGFKIVASPNPTDGVLQLELYGFEGGPNEVFTTIHDATGKVTGHQSMAKFGDMYKGFYNLRTYPAGIYYIWIKNGEVNEMVKVVKI